MTTFDQQVEAAKEWFASSRFAGIVRLYSPREVAEQQGTISIDYAVARRTAEQFYALLGNLFAQRVRHRDVVRIVDENGQPVLHSPEFITNLFDEDLDRILRELPADTPAETTAQFKQARAMSEQMIVSDEFNPK